MNTIPMGQKKRFKPLQEKMASRKPGAFQRAVDSCKGTGYRSVPPLIMLGMLAQYGDSELKGAWLLLYMNHWFHEKV